MWKSKKSKKEVKHTSGLKMRSKKIKGQKKNKLLENQAVGWKITKLLAYK